MFQEHFVSCYKIKWWRKHYSIWPLWGLNEAPRVNYPSWCLIHSKDLKLSLALIFSVFLQQDCVQGGRCVGHRRGIHHFPFLPKSDSHRWTLRIQCFCLFSLFFPDLCFIISSWSTQKVLRNRPTVNSEGRTRACQKSMIWKRRVWRVANETTSAAHFSCLLGICVFRRTRKGSDQYLHQIGQKISSTEIYFPSDGEAQMA